MNFEIVYDKQPEKFLEKLDKHIARRILDKIDDLLIKNPVPHEAKTIVGEHRVFRIRVEIIGFFIELIIPRKGLLYLK